MCKQNKKLVMSLAGCVLLGMQLPAIERDSARDTVVLVGDSTVEDVHKRRDLAGWGWGLEQIAGDGVRVFNEAKSGRSSRSFRTEGRWDAALKRDPDWILIQFGHNDQPGKGPKRESEADTAYRDHLLAYVREAEEVGARPVIVTPICRRTFREDGVLKDSLEKYAAAARAVAAEADVPCLDLHAYSYRRFSDLGPEKSAEFGPSDKPVDKTHFSKEASQTVAGWVRHLMENEVPELAALFDPADQILKPVWQLDVPGVERDGVTTIAGPLPGGKGAFAKDQSIKVTSQLKAIGPLEAGTLSCWVYLPEALLSGPENESWRQYLVSVPGQFEISMGMNPRFLGFYFHWRGDWRAGGYVRSLIPGISGPGWHHIAAVWDVSRGYHNLYVDGSPALMEDFQYWDSMDPPEPQSLISTLGRFGLSQVRLFDRVLSREELETELTPLYKGASDFLFGQRSLGQLNVNTDEMQLLHEDNLTDPERASEWILEGRGDLEYSKEGLHMESAAAAGEMGHFVYWLDKRLPENFVAEWDVQILSEHGLNIVFFNASGPGGRSIFATEVKKRNGDFKQYHSGDLDSYHISYYADTPNSPGRATSNLRKNSGFYLVANGPPGIEAESSQKHRITLFKKDGLIRLAVDGELAIDWRDDGVTYGPVHGSGWFGLRQMKWTEARYSNLKIYGW